jgi:glycosyltransferase involved in cell wall biosynthesis
MPWDLRLGGPKPQMMIAAELRRLGHTVEKFDCHDAFPEHKAWSPLLLRIFGPFLPDFSQRAKAFIKAHGHRFDVIDVQHGSLPFSKQQLGFTGLVVARSVGLYAFHEEFRQLALRKWPRKGLGKIPGIILRYLRKPRERRSTIRFVATLSHADCIMVPNQDEWDYVNSVLKLGAKCVSIPYGLTKAQFAAFASAAVNYKDRLARKTVVFIGSWGPGKGSKDWPEIIRCLQKNVPEVRFLFLGTSSYSSASQEAIIKELDLPNPECMTIIPRFTDDEFPQLLSQATVAAFPSYVEGFPIAVLEQLAAGLPVVAYDIPGPREMLRHLKGNFLYPPGNSQDFSQKLTELLNMDDSAYVRLSQQCTAIARGFDWEGITAETLEAYIKFSIS